MYAAELYIGLKDIPNKYPVEKGFDFALNNVHFSTVRLRPPLFEKKKLNRLDRNRSTLGTVHEFVLRLETSDSSPCILEHGSMYIETVGSEHIQKFNISIPYNT